MASHRQTFLGLHHYTSAPTHLSSLGSFFSKPAFLIESVRTPHKQNVVLLALHLPLIGGNVIAEELVYDLPNDIFLLTVEALIQQFLL